MRFHIALVALIALAGAGISLAAEHTKDSLAEVKKNLADKKAVLVDVREKSEWDRGHLKDARLFPLSELKKVASDAGIKETLAKKLPKDRIIYCHCARGVRALFAGETLEKLGYDVRPLEAGYDELRKSGFAIEAGDSK